MGFRHSVVGKKSNKATQASILWGRGVPALVRMHYVRERKLEVLAGGGERVLYRFPDGRVMSNWQLVHSPDYESFKRGFKDGFEGRPPASVFDIPLKTEYETGYSYGSREREKYTDV